MQRPRIINRVGWGCTALALTAGFGCDGAPREITVERINVVDGSGEVRLVIAGSLPDPVVRGEQLERAISPAGILWHDQDGNESGGIASAPVSGGTQRMIVFDFTHQPTDAIGLGTFETDDGRTWMAGLRVFDRLPHSPGPVQTSQGTQRIVLGTQNQNAGLVILDPQERERIRIGVDPDGVALFEILDEEGRVVYRAPEQPESPHARDG